MEFSMKVLLMSLLLMQIAFLLTPTYANMEDRDLNITSTENVTTDEEAKPLQATCGQGQYQDEHIPNYLNQKQKRIVGGQESKQGEWPWLVSMMRVITQETSNGSILRSVDHDCGGTLITPQWVLSAAHCFETRLSPNLTIVRIGEHNLYEEDVPHVEIEVELIINHPNYSQSVKYENDVALVKLVRPVTYGDNVNIACLPSADYKEKTNTMCVVAGWGRAEERVTKVRHVVVPLITNKLCQKMYNKDSWRTGQIADSMICAGYYGGGKDSCQGDSGGPMMCFDSAERQWDVIGVVSWGEGCGLKSRPGVYARVPYLLGWIKDTMENNSK